MGFASDLIARHEEAWRGCVRAPFLDRCKDGSLDPRDFETWLIQDFFFARECTRFIALNVANAPFKLFSTLLGGLTAIDDELQWFQGELEKRNITVEEHNPLPVCAHYIEYLNKSTDIPYAVQLTILWVVEKAYHDSWRLNSPMADPFGTYAQRWASTAFGEYIHALEGHLDNIMEQEGSSVREAATEVFLEVCKLEQEFWGMTCPV